MTDFLANVGGVLSYSTAGHTKACGQVIGANGAGTFCVIFVASPEDAAEMARQHIRKLEREGHAGITALFAPNDDTAGYHGNPISVVSCKVTLDTSKTT
jgi:hypothetical protein